MSRFDIKDFLKQNKIEYVESGKNVKKGNINIKCPFCGDRDRSFHLGIHPKKSHYACWLNSDHRGKNLVNLIAKLLNCSFSEAKRIIGENNDTVLDSDSFYDDVMSSLFKETGLEMPSKSDNEFFLQSKKQKKELFLCKEFKALEFSPYNIFHKYLKDRGFFDYKNFCRQYNIHYAVIGDFKNRIIFPYSENSKYITWQGRTVNGSNLKYQDLSEEKSIKKPKDILYNYDNINSGGRVLYITEGIFDCLKIDYYSFDDVKATCLSTKTLRDSQMYSLYSLSKKFEEIRILLDRDARQEAFTIRDSLPFKSVVWALPNNVNDPGELTSIQVLKYLN